VRLDGPHPGTAGRSPRPRDERGFTLVEMMVVVLVMGILFAISTPIVSTVLQTSSHVDVTYSNVDEQLWLSTVLQRFVRSAVAPTPTVTGHTPPVPAFKAGTITPTSMTFYTNTGTSRGPEKVVAKCTPESSTDTTACQSPTATFSVTVYKPQVTARTHKSFCPSVTGTLTHHCLYTTASYAITSRVLVTISHVKNGLNGQPLFVFAYGPEPTPGEPMTTTTICAPGYTGTCTSNDHTSFTKCTVGTVTQPFENCLAGEIQTVTYDLQINAKTTVHYGGGQAEDDTGIFVLSSTSMQYDPSVG
jgi:prepilin-type N-terminal cleavage/methylation domain-containing protein